MSWIVEEVAGAVCGVAMKPFFPEKKDSYASRAAGTGADWLFKRALAKQTDQPRQQWRT